MGIALASALALTAAGCSSGNQGDISAAAAKSLQAQVQRVREAVASGSLARAEAALNALRRLVEQERAAGRLSDARAQEIDDRADALQADLEQAASPTPTPAPTSSSPSPSPSATPSATQTSPPASATPTPTQTTPPPSPTMSVTVTVGAPGDTPAPTSTIAAPSSP
jgi:hypothetical protein